MRSRRPPTNRKRSSSGSPPVTWTGHGLQIGCARTSHLTLHRPRHRGFMDFQTRAIIEREGDGYVSLCPELDIASQGDSVEEARRNLQEAVELFFETASPEEIQHRGQKGSSGAPPPPLPRPPRGDRAPQ